MSAAQVLRAWLVTCGLGLLAQGTPMPVLAETMETVRLGLHAGPRREWSRTELRATFDLWGQELADKFKIPVSFRHYDDPAEMRRDFLAGKINGVQADAMTFVRYFKSEELAEGYATMMKGSWNLMLFARRDGTMKDLSDLAGKRIAVLEDDPAIEIYLETQCMHHLRRPCKAVFSDIQRVGTSNQALMRVFFGKADVALVYGYGHELAVELNPRLGQTLRTLAEYPMHSLFFGFYSARTPTALRERTLPIMPTLHTYPRGRQLLDVFKIERLERVTPTALQPAFALERDYLQLKAALARGGKPQ